MARVAVRVQAAHHVADDAGALDVPAVGPQAHLGHLEQDAALHRLEPVARVGQGARVDDRVGVLEERALHLGGDVDVFDALAGGGGGAAGGRSGGVVRGSHKIGAMLPAAKTSRFSLADVLPNCLDALAGRTGRLGLPPVTHAVVLLADGLGRTALEAHRGHARTLASRLDVDPAISAGFPTTTASALATLTTGALARPARHGRLPRARSRPATAWSTSSAASTTLDPAHWQRMPTLFETRGGVGRAVGRDRLAAAPRLGVHPRGAARRRVPRRGDRSPTGSPPRAASSTRPARR